MQELLRLSWCTSRNNFLSSPLLIYYIVGGVCNGNQPKFIGKLMTYILVKKDKSTGNTEILCSHSEANLINHAKEILNSSLADNAGFKFESIQTPNGFYAFWNNSVLPVAEQNCFFLVKEGPLKDQLVIVAYDDFYTKANPAPEYIDAWHCSEKCRIILPRKIVFELPRFNK